MFYALIAGIQSKDFLFHWPVCDQMNLLAAKMHMTFLGTKTYYYYCFRCTQHSVMILKVTN